MNSEDIFPVCFLLIGGLGPLILGILIWTGYTKTWFVIERVPVILPTAFYNGSLVFLGLIPIIIVVVLLTETFVLCFSVPLLMALAIVLAIWQPKWIQPAWYRWLEENHEEIIPILKEDVRRTGPREWQRRVATQEGLEQWVEEVKRKHGLL